MKFALYGDGNVGPLDLHASMHPPTEGSKPRFGGIVSRALAPPDAINCAPCLLATSVPPRIKVTTLESQLIHLIQELSGRTLSNVGVYGQGEDSPESPLPTGNQPGVFGASSDQNGVQGWPNFHTGMYGESAWGFGVSGFGWECEGVIGASGYEGAAASWRVVCAMCCRCGTTVLR